VDYLINVLASLTASFILATGRRIPAWLIVAAVKMLPKEERSRFREEWLAHLDELDGFFMRLGHGLRCAEGAARLRKELIHRPQLEKTPNRAMRRIAVNISRGSCIAASIAYLVAIFPSIVSEPTVVGPVASGPAVSPSNRITVLASSASGAPVSAPLPLPLTLSAPATSTVPLFSGSAVTGTSAIQIGSDGLIRPDGIAPSTALGDNGYRLVSAVGITSSLNPLVTGTSAMQIGSDGLIRPDGIAPSTGLSDGCINDRSVLRFVLANSARCDTPRLIP